MRQSGGGSLFHAHGPAAAKDRSPSDDIVYGTATKLDVVDLRPDLSWNSLRLATEGWPGWVAGYIPRQFTRPKMVTHPGTN